MAETKPTSLLEQGLAKSKKVAEQRKNTTATQPTSGQSTATATEPYVYEAKTSRRSTGLTPADQQKAIDKVAPKPRAQAEQPQVRRDATNYTPAVKQRQPIQTPLEKKKEESQANATPIKIMEAEALGIDKYNYDMELPQEFVDDLGRGGIDKLFEHVSMSQDDDYNESLLRAAIKYVNATYPNEGVIEFNGKKYDKGSLAMSLVPLMRERGHQVLMRGNAKYRDDWAAKQGFGNFNVWLAAQDSELAKLEEEISKTWKDRTSDDMGWKMAARGTLGHVFPIINALPFIDRDASGVKHIRDLRDAIKLMRNGDYTAFDEFMKGAEEGFDYMNMLSFGMSGLAADTMRNRVLDKAYNGEELTPDEERILNIYKKEQEIRGYDHNAGSMTRQLGSTMGYMGQELPQYIWGGKIAGGVLKAGAKYMPNVVKGVVAATRGNKAVAPLRWGLKATGDYGAGLVAAPFLPGTYERFVEKRNEQYSIEDGKLKKDPKSALSDALTVWFEQAGEIGSELTGARMADFLDSSLLSLGSEVGVYKWLNKITPAIGGVETSKALRYAKSTSHRAAQQAAQYSGGVVTEGLGEAWGSFTAEVMKEAVLGEGNFEQFKDAEFWALTFGASGLAGLGFDAPTTVMDWVDYYRDLRTLSGTKKNAISKVEHTDLKNALIALSAGGNIKESTEHLAELDWENGGYSLEEIGYAMDYIRAEAMQQERMGEATESERLQRFGKVAKAINNITYHNEVGEATDSIISAMDKEGNTYYILEGDITNPEAMLKAMDSEGKVVSLLASNVSGYSKASVAETSQHYYREMFSTEFNMQRLESAEYAIDRMDNPTMEQVANVAKRVGIVMPKEGDTITLVDGRTAKVASISDDLGIMAEMTDGEGNVSQVTIPIMQILSSNTYIAEAQKLQNAEDALELAQAEEAQAEVEEAVEENEATTDVATEEASNGLVGTEVTLPNGTKGTIVEVDGDDVIVDTGRGVDAYEVYSKEELGMTEAAEITTTPAEATAEQTTSEAATEQTTGEVTPEQATEALNKIAGIEPMPTLKDGSIDYDAIDDAETFAKHFEHDMGGREEAIKSVQEMREQAMADLAEAEKKGKKVRSANEKVANKAERQRLAERIAFYDNVLDVYSPKAEAPATPIESAPQVDTTPSQTEVAEVTEATLQTMETATTTTAQGPETHAEATEATEEEALSAEEIWAAERREGYAVPDQNGQLVGLHRNELSEQLEENTRHMINDVATAFGVLVTFQREVRSSAGNLVNGKIDGTTVYFNWGKREHTLTWLMGHEFTHRMKSLAPEAYNKLRDAVRAYLGEEKWNQRIEKQRKIYEERENPEEILSSAESAAIWKEAREQTKREDGSYNEEAAKKLYNKKVAEARREAYIEEVVCDEVGVLARDHKAFDRFLRSEHVRNDGKFLRWLRKVWQSLMNAFSHDARTFNEVMKTLDELINVSTAKVAKGTQVSNEERNAVTPEVAEATERIESKGGVVDAQRGDVKYALSDVLTVPERESAIQDLMRVTGRSRATVQKYLKAEQSLARIIADDDNRAFLDLQVDESVPSIWNNSDYPQGTVEFSNICRKRLPLTMIYQQLQKEFPNTVFDASTLETIRGVLKENGIDVACGLCFVEDRRQLLGEIGKGFISALKGENVDVNEKQKEAIASLKDTYIPNLYELLTLDGMKALKKTHPEVANAFVAYNNARGMQAGRLFQAYSAYHREILGYSEARVKKINASGGLRIFSFSDFEAHHLIDLVQVLTDCARKGIKVQGYTKVPEFARAVKDTGMKLNRSLIAKGDGYVDADYTPKKNEAVSPNVVDGKRLLLDCVEGIDVNHKDFFDSSSSHNVGNILVGINDEQIRIAMLDPFVDYIIPFHSGLSEAIRKQKGIGDWQNYKLEQLEKKDNGSGKLVNADKHGVNIYTEVLNEDIKTEKQFVERYLEVCKEKGWIPKFHRFLNKNKKGDFVYTKGYYKLLLDFKMFDAKGRILPQEVVQPIFDDAFNKEILEDYVKGEKAKMPNDEVYNKVKEALDLGGAKFSLAYHGSGADFDKFDHSFMSSGEGQQIFGWGTYVSEVEDIAKTYAESSGKPNNIGHLITGLKHRISAITQNIEHLNKRIEVYAKDAEYVDRLNAQKEELQKEISKAESEVSRLESLNVEQGKILYTVDIPEDTGDNYIEYDKPVSKGIRSKVNKALDEYNEVFVDDMRESLGVDDTMSDQEVLGLLRSNISMTSGKEMYADLSRELGGDKEASLFLADAGVAGISYPAEVTTGGRADNARNYVIFNADEVKIIEKTRYSLSDTSAYQASAEVFVMLGGYKSKQITLNGLVKAVENIAKKYSKIGLLDIALEEYNNGDTKEFINALKGFVSVYPPTMLRDYSGDKATIEETFGGIWIEDTEEFAKFVSAVNKSPFEEDGEGVAYTDNYFYAYYRNIDGQPIPYASVYLNRGESQNIVDIILKAKRNEEKRGVRRYFDRAYDRARHISGENDGNLSSNKKLPYSRRNDRLDSELPRYGAYYDSPELFVKSKRTYKGSKVAYSLITLEMDASYLDAVERGDMATAQKMVMEAADGTRYSLREESAPTRYSLQSGDMPFFNDNGDIITFDNTDITGEDYDAIELRSPMPTTPRTTKDVIKAHLSARHNAAKERIRRESRVMRDAVRKQYNEEQIRRREGVESMRTNAAKVDYIIGAPIETLDYEAQVLAKIATGTLSISWESLKKELGVKDGDKRSYRHITNGATATLDAVVHDWWQAINGYERGIDTQDLRNALIDVLIQVPTAKGALSILEDRFDHALRNRDESLEDIDREEDRLIAEEDARYNEQMTTLSDPARMREYIRQYEQTVGFHEELTAIEGTLRKMDSELKAVRKRAERAQMRSRASKQKQSASFKEVREAIAEGKRALLEALSTYEQLGFNKQEVRSFVDAVNKARSMADINKVRVKIENVILNVSIREKRRHMDQMLNLRLPSGELVETWVSKQIHDGKMSVADGKRILADMFRGTNANGVRVAKFVDDETARVMDYLRNNLIVPNHGGHYQDKVDADGNIIGREYVPSREVTEGADILMVSNEKKMNELLEKKINGDITEEENIELLARQLYTPYLFAANARANVKEVRAEGEKMYEEIQRKKAEMGDAYTKEMRDADYAALEANSLHLVEAKTVYDEALTEYNETLGNVIMEGRDNLRMFREGKEAHKAEVVGMAIKAIGGEARTIASQPTVAEKIAAWNRTAFHSTYWTFDSACREIDRFAPNGEGEFYKHFMGGWREASNNFFTRSQNHVLSICEAVGRITGSGKDSSRALQAFIRKADMATVGTITYKNDKGKVETTPLRVSNALFILAMWEQSQYREIMEKRGISEEQIESLKTKIASIDEHYLDFKDWVVQEFLPSTRLEYNEVHKQVFGASMDNIPNYFPAKVVEGYREADIANNESGLPSTMTGSIITRQKHNNMPDFGQSFFSVLLNHLQNMDQWASFTPLVEDMNAVLSNPEFKRLANAHMSGKNNDRSGKGSLWQIFKDTSAVAIGSFRCESNVADDIVKFLTGSWAASNITWRFSTALKQLSGLTAVAFSGFGKTQTMWAKNMALCPMALKWAMENSPMLQRRFGDRFAGNEALMQQYGQKQAKGLDLNKGKLKNGLERVNDFIHFLTVDVGMTPNAAVDALVVAVTMKTVYDVELSNLTKGKPETATEEQKSYAMMKAEIFANETQQSGEGAYMSLPQAQRSVVTAALTTYLNASFASHRLRVQGAQDIYHWLKSDYRNEIDARYGKGAARKAAVKGLGRLLAGLSIDATFILMSRALSQGLWKLIIDWFDDTEDDDDEADPIDWNDIGKEIGLNVAFGGLIGGNIVTTLGNGFTFTPIPALDELKKDVFKALGWTDKKIKDGDYSIDLSLWTFGEIIFKYGYGLDPETMLNIARGIEGICRDKDPMAAMKILNTPQSMVNIIAGPRRDNETAKEYVERRARLEVLFAQPKYSELYDDEGKFIGKGKYDVVGGAKDYRLKGLLKDYNERQRATVMNKEFSKSEVAEFERIDSEYKAIVEPLGWEVGNNPEDNLVDKTGWRNIYPEGLRQEHYAALKGIATAAEQTRRAQDRWVGSDQGYADLVREEYNLREQLIAGRRSSYKAKTAKEKIDKIEREKKANKKNKSQKK